MPELENARDLEDILCGLQCLLGKFDMVEYCNHPTCPYWVEGCELGGCVGDPIVKDALGILMPRVLSLMEMKDISNNGNPVYIETPDGECCWALTIPGLEPPDKDGFRYPGGVLFNAVDANGSIYDGDFYDNARWSPSWSCVERMDILPD